MGIHGGAQAAMLTCVALNLISIALRLYVRIFITRSPAFDDWVIVAAFATFTAFCGLLWTSIFLGFAASDPFNLSYNLMEATKYFIIANLLNPLALFLVKISVAFVLYRLTDNNRPIRLVIHANVAFITAGMVFAYVVLGRWCVPLSVAWGVGTGTCLPADVIANTSYCLIAMDSVSNFIFATLPILVLKDVRLDRRAKISIIILLGLGFISSIVGMMRIESLVRFAQSDKKVSNVMNILIRSTICSIVEMGLAILTASLSTLKPLLRRLRLLTTSRSRHTGPPSRSAALNSAKNQQRPRGDIELQGPGNEAHDLGHADGSSQEQIIPPEPVVKHQAVGEAQAQGSACPVAYPIPPASIV